MINSSKLKKQIAGAVYKVAAKTAERSTNSACGWFQYQPKMPKSLKKN